MRSRHDVVDSVLGQLSERNMKTNIAVATASQLIPGKNSDQKNLT